MALQLHNNVEKEEKRTNQVNNRGMRNRHARSQSFLSLLANFSRPTRKKAMPSEACLETVVVCVCFKWANASCRHHKLEQQPLNETYHVGLFGLEGKYPKSPSVPLGGLTEQDRRMIASSSIVKLHHATDATSYSI